MPPRIPTPCLGRRADLILVTAVLAGFLVALARGGRPSQLAELPLRLGWLAMTAVLAQLYVIYSPADRVEADRSLHSALLVASYTALLAMVWANRRVAGIAVLALGLWMNMAVILANGGFMPVSPEAVLVAGTRAADSLPDEGARLPKSKDVLLFREHTNLWYLSDAIADGRLPYSKVYSLGDLFLGAGVFLVIQLSMSGSKKSVKRVATGTI